MLSAICWPFYPGLNALRAHTEGDTDVHHKNLTWLDCFIASLHSHNGRWLSAIMEVEGDY